MLRPYSGHKLHNCIPTLCRFAVADNDCRKVIFDRMESYGHPARLNSSAKSACSAARALASRSRLVPFGANAARRTASCHSVALRCSNSVICAPPRQKPLSRKGSTSPPQRGHDLSPGGSARHRPASAAWPKRALRPCPPARLWPVSIFAARPAHAVFRTMP